MTAMPVWSVAGVTVTVWFAPLPPMTILLMGTRVRLLDPRVIVSEPTGLSISAIVKGSAPVLESSSITDSELLLLMVDH